MVNVALILCVMALFWWVLLIANKDISLFLFPILTGAVWINLEMWIALQGNVVALLILAIPIVILSPIVRIITEY